MDDDFLNDDFILDIMSEEISQVDNDNKELGLELDNLEQLVDDMSVTSPSTIIAADISLLPEDSQDSVEQPVVEGSETQPEEQPVIDVSETQPQEQPVVEVSETQPEEPVISETQPAKQPVIEVSETQTEEQPAEGYQEESPAPESTIKTSSKYQMRPDTSPDSSFHSPLSSPLSTPGGHDGHDHEGEEGEYGEEESGEVEDGKVKKKQPKHPLGENFMDFTWKKPDKELAAKRGKAGIWQGGERVFKETSVHDFGDMSDGMELYFYVVRALVGLFFVLSLLSVPLLTIATAGNRGMAIEEASFPAQQSLGNTGYNPEADGAASFCRDQEGLNKCVSMRYIFGLEIEARYVTFVISAYEALISVVMISVSTWLLMSVERKADEIDGEVSTPADFTVFVRNLPKDVSESALIAHFSMRYDLSRPQPRYPVMGYSTFGASLTIGFVIALIFGLIAGGSLTPFFGALGSLAAPVLLLLLTGFFTLILWLCNFGAPKNRLTPAEEWDEAEELRNKHREEMATEREKDKEKIRKYNAKHGKVVPEGEEDAALVRQPKKKCGCCGCLCCCCKKKATPALLEGIDVDGLSADLPRPDPQPVSNLLHNGYPPVLGGWVADLHIVYPNGSIISSYLKQKALMAKIQGMRSKIQQFKDDTPYEKGANPKKVEKFTKQLGKLQKKMEKVHEKVARKVKDTRTAANCEGCFITFNHEESRARCLDDYRASSSWIGRYFQPRSLQFMWSIENQDLGTKTETITSLRVEQAPEPSDIFWEKLHVTDGNRMMRVIGSNLITLTVLLLSFVIALNSASQTQAASEAIASTNYCEHIPAIWYGKYYNHTPGDLWDTTATYWVRNHTKDVEVCGGKGYYIVNEEFEAKLEYDRLPRFKPPSTADSTVEIDRPSFDSSYVPGVSTGIDAAQVCDDVCHYPSATKNYPNRTGCAGLSCHEGLTDWAPIGYPCFEGNTYYPPSAVANCYCTQLYWETARTLPAEDADLCQDFFSVLDNSYFFQIMSILTVVAVNGAALPIIEALVTFEKHVSVSAEKQALVSKMFSLQFMNTAIITLIVNTAYSGSIGLGPFAWIGVGEGDYSNFNMDWYLNIGAALCITMFTQIFSPHASPLIKKFAANPLKRTLLAGSASTQEQVRRVYMCV